MKRGILFLIGLLISTSLWGADIEVLHFTPPANLGPGDACNVQLTLIPQPGEKIISVTILVGTVTEDDKKLRPRLESPKKPRKPSIEIPPLKLEKAPVPENNISSPRRPLVLGPPAKLWKDEKPHLLRLSYNF